MTPRRARTVAAITNLKLTAASALATLLATLTLWPLFVHRDWLRASLVVIVVAAVVGATGRALGSPRGVTALAQVAALAMTLTVLFAPGDAVAGIVPTSRTVSALLDLVNTGTTGIEQQTIPVLDGPGIVLIVALGIGLAAIAVDLLAVELRSPVAAGLVLAAIYGVTATVLATGASWMWFCAAAVGWLILLYAVHRENLRAWGRSLTPSAGWWERVASEPADPRAVLARRVGAGAVLSAVVVAALLPGVGDGVLDGFTHHSSGGSGAGSGSGGQHTVTLNLDATLGGNLQNPTNTRILTYRSTTPEYLRLTVLDHFDGTSWLPATQPDDGPSVDAGAQHVEGLSTSTVNASTAKTTVTTTGAALHLAYLPLPYDATNVGITGGGTWQWDTSTATVFSRDAAVGARTYTVSAANLTPAVSTLTAAGVTGDEAAYSTVPGGLPAVVKQTAETVTAQSTGEYDSALLLQDWFRTNFTYSTNISLGDSSKAIQTFLKNRVGYCQQFAAAYALMARTLGIPSRVVVGFAPGTKEADGRYVVGTHDYHAWPELWFDGAGWVRFEPTPRSDADSTVSVPVYAQTPDASNPTNATPNARPTASSQPRATSQPKSRAHHAATPSITRSVTSLRSDRSAGLLTLFALLVLLAAAPGAARALRRRRRLQMPPGDAQVEAGWAELADTARDLGLRWNADDTPRRAADALVRDASLQGASAVAVQELRHDVEQVRYARRRPLARDLVPDTASQVTTIRSALAGRSSGWARVRATVLPRTAWNGTRARRRGLHEQD